MSRIRKAASRAGSLTLACLLPLCACARSSARIAPVPTPAFPTVWTDQPSLPAQVASAAPAAGPPMAASPVPVDPDAGATPLPPGSVASSTSGPTVPVVVGVPVLDAMAAGDVQVTLVGVHRGEHMEVRVLSEAARPLSLRLGPGSVSIRVLNNPEIRSKFVLYTREGISFDLAPGGSASALVSQAGPTRLGSGSVTMVRDKRGYGNANVKVLSVILAPSPQEQLASCSPGCPSGSACMHGTCASLCEGPCAGGLVCNDEGKCAGQ